MRCCLRPCFTTGSRVCSVRGIETRTTTSSHRSKYEQRRYSTHLAIAPDFSDRHLRRSSHKRRFLPWPLAAWSQDVEFSSAKVISNIPAATQIQRLRLDIGEGIRTYSKAGQFVQIRIGESKPAFMAIASPPSDPTVSSAIDLIVKCIGETAEQICTLEPGDQLEVSDVMGKGFPIEKIPSEEISDVWIIATGTGIAPIAAVIDSPAFEMEKRRTVKLYYGVRNSDAVSISREIENWSNNHPNLQIRVVFSEQGDGYVQDVVAKDLVDFDGARTGVLLCGQKDMCERITSLMTDAGVPSERVLMNF